MKKDIIGLALIVLLLLITVGYASTNNTTGNIEYKNIKVLSTNTNESITKDKDTIKYNADLNLPGDYFEFTTDIVNNTSEDLVLDSNINNNLDKKYLIYKVTYLNNKPLQKGDKLPKNSKVTIKVRVEYNKDIVATDLPTRDDNIDLSLNLNYVQDL